jgi:hypothetical protein
LHAPPASLSVPLQLQCGQRRWGFTFPVPASEFCHSSSACNSIAESWR